MIFKDSPFSIQNSSFKDFENTSNKDPNLDEMITENNIASKKTKTVHRRRDLDSLG